MNHTVVATSRNVCDWRKLSMDKEDQNHFGDTNRAIVACLYNKINKIQYNTIQYNTIRYDTIRYNTIQYNTIQYNTIQYDTIQYNTIQYSLTLKPHRHRCKLISLECFGHIIMTRCGTVTYRQERSPTSHPVTLRVWVRA